MEYQAISKKFVIFELTKDDHPVGKIIYNNWFKFDAEIEIGNKKYQVEQKGFWGTTIALKENEDTLVEFKMNWSGEVVLHALFEEIEKGYMFKHKTLFKESFALIDQDGTELLILKPHLKWNSMQYEYYISTSDEFELLPNKVILLMSSLHCANYYKSLTTSYMGT